MVSEVLAYDTDVTGKDLNYVQLCAETFLRAHFPNETANAEIEARYCDAVESEGIEEEGVWTCEAGMRAIGWDLVDRGNTYNSECDLDNAYIWEVYVPAGTRHDEYYHRDPEEVVYVTFLHRGGDLRANYRTAAEFWTNCEGPYSVPLDLVAEVWPCDLVDLAPGPDPSQGILDIEVETVPTLDTDREYRWNVIREAFEKYQTGYHPLPTYLFAEEWDIVAEDSTGPRAGAEGRPTPEAVAFVIATPRDPSHPLAGRRVEVQFGIYVGC